MALKVDGKITTSEAEWVEYAKAQNQDGIHEVRLRGTPFGYMLVDEGMFAWVVIGNNGRLYVDLNTRDDFRYLRLPPGQELVLRLQTQE